MTIVNSNTSIGSVMVGIHPNHEDEEYKVIITLSIKDVSLRLKIENLLKDFQSSQISYFVLSDDDFEDSIHFKIFCIDKAIAKKFLKAALVDLKTISAFDHKLMPLEKIEHKVVKLAV